MLLHYYKENMYLSGDYVYKYVFPFIESTSKETGHLTIINITILFFKANGDGAGEVMAIKRRNRVLVYFFFLINSYD